MSARFVPELFGDFLLVQRLATRAMSDVLVAVRLGDRSGQTFVVKRPVLGERASGRAAQSIQREGEVLAAVRAPSLCALEAYGELGGLPYVALEHVRGAALDEIATRDGPMSEGAVRAVALDVARALAALHAKGWVHGDVAASNVMVDDTGEAKLVDLGLARRTGESRPEVSGTPGYLAPEAALPGEVKAASDVYGWAVVVAECALGRRLFPAEEDLASAATRGELPRGLDGCSKIVPGLAAALARDPGARPTCTEIVRELEGLALDRVDLAARVEARRREEDHDDESRALTPTAPMVNEVTVSGSTRDGFRSTREGLVVPTVIETTITTSTREGLGSTRDGLPEAPRPQANVHPPPAPTSPRSQSVWVITSLLVVLVFVLGQVSARMQVRRQPGSVYVGGVTTPRARLEVDGQKVTSPADGRLRLTNGEHTVVVTLPKGTRREYTFDVHPNEQVVLVAPRKGAGNKDDDAEER